MDSAARFTGLALDADTVDSLEAVLPRMAERTVAAVIAEVPAYTDPFSGRMGQNIENAVQTALGAFLRLATRAQDSDPGPPLSPALDGAYELGRGEARNGRSIDALLSAYRVGARVAWRELSDTAVGAGLSATTIARFAELVFAFIDQLSAASVSGHTDEQATAGRVRQRYLDVLTNQLLAGESPEIVRASAERASWPTPETLTAVLLPAAETVAAADGAPACARVGPGAESRAGAGVAERSASSLPDCAAGAWTGAGAPASPTVTDGVATAPRRGELLPESAGWPVAGRRTPRWLSLCWESDADDADGPSVSGVSAAAIPAAWGPTSETPSANAATPARAPRLTTDIDDPCLRRTLGFCCEVVAP